MFKNNRSCDLLNFFNGKKNYNLAQVIELILQNLSCLIFYFLTSSKTKNTLVILSDTMFMLALVGI